MKIYAYILLVVLPLLPTAEGWAQGKFFGGDGRGYACSSATDTVQCQVQVGSTNVTACSTATVNGQTYTQSGTYLQNLVATSGCDSLLNVAVVIGSVDTTVMNNGVTLTAQGTGTYQWLDCDQSWGEILGATQQSFSPGSTGNYALQIISGSCIDTSGCHYILILGNEGPGGREFQVFPNPSVERVVIKWDGRWMDPEIHVLDMLGRPLGVYRGWEPGHTWEHRLAAGMYLLRLVDGEGRSVTATLQVVAR